MPDPQSTVTQDAPTAPRPIDADGRTLDSWGLPLTGPARVARLAALGKPDPADQPDAWSAPPAPPPSRARAADTAPDKD